MERETRSFTLSNGKVLVLKAYRTAKEKRQIDSFFTKSAKLRYDTETQKTVVDGFDAAITEQAEDALISTMVVSYDGVGEKVLERLLDEPEAVYAEARQHIAETIDPPKGETK